MMGFFVCWNSTAYAEVLPLCSNRAYLILYVLLESAQRPAFSISWNTGKTVKKRVEESYNEAECMARAVKMLNCFRWKDIGPN